MTTLMKRWSGMRRQRFLLLMAIPGMAYFIVFDYVPLYGLLIAFKDYKLAAGQTFFQSILSSPWVGLEHFHNFLNSYNFVQLLRNTFLLSLYSILFGFPLPILFALLLNELRNALYKKVVQTVSYLPHFISLVAVVGMLKMLLSPESGMINAIISGAMGTEMKYYFGDPSWFRTLFVASGVWQNLGWGAIIYIAALSKVDPELYESAVMDGATRLRQMWHITLPAMKTTIVIMLILSMSGLLSVGAEKVILMYSPATYETADVLSTYVYRKGLTELNFSFGAAVGLLNSVINVIFLVAANYAAKKISQESLW